MRRGRRFFQDFGLFHNEERASLTRGTLYRNFPHRQAMYEAVLEQDLRAIAEQLALEQETGPLALIRRMTELMMIYDKFLVALADITDYDVAKNEARMVDAMTAPLAAAQASGLLHPRLTGTDILMACRMLASHWKLDHQENFNRAFDSRFALLMYGLRA